MNYPILFFDLDETLFDTKKNSKEALRKITVIPGFPFTDEQVMYWNRLSDKLWEQFSDEKITRTELLNIRFEKFFDHYGVKVDGVICEQEFEKHLVNEGNLLPHAKELLMKLSSRRVFAVTNGSKYKQLPQLNKAGLTPYFEGLLMAEDIGYRKPDPKFFQTIMQKIGIDSKDKILMIGDSLTADIKGARQFGIDSVWYNPQKLSNTTNIKPSYEIEDLISVLEII